MYDFRHTLMRMSQCRLILCLSGATLVQLYTALAYEGPSIVPKMKQQLAACLEADGFSSVQEAVGVDHLVKNS